MPATPSVTTGIGLRSERGPVLAAVMLSTALIAIDSTIIATAVPSVVADIGGFAQFPWLFSVYLLAQAVTVPVYGKLADLFGRKPVIMFGIATFLVGSVLCGVATSMTMLIVFRVVQGLGAGGIAPMTVTIVGDLYTVEERAKVQGYVASVWGISSVVGPTLGGVFSEYVSWRWIFLVNIPLCLLAGGMIMKHYHERRTPARPVIDYRGAVLLTAGLTLLILGVLEGGQAWAWDSGPSIATLGIGALLLAVFLFVERRTTEPILPLWVFRRRLLVASGVVSAGAGAILLGLTSYVPTYAQEALGVGPLVAGLALAALTLGWPIAASQSGRVYLRFGFRRCALAGASIIVVGCALLLLLDGGSSVWQVGVTSLVIGLGMGLTVSPTLIASQSSVGWRDRGVVTANNLFLRSVGSSLGTAVFGAVANATLRGGHDDPVRLVRAVHGVFVGVLIVAVVVAVAAAFFPRGDVLAPAE
ncbi:MDR family MFS transporter [Asanoa siamensis]|uniref:MFS transporter n=1 Tax=Asanoa siamensis TaxID=926357 RepID=A0ABQ4CRB3_9ACTN|nr:MDR family MFS transporter [Asanoa siamensis]GIF73826.1 MFS transporter [Asanoa siamensis]